MWSRSIKIAHRYFHRFAGEKVYQQAQKVYRSLRRKYYLKISGDRLKKYNDRFCGRRCFIIGNGPSLKNMDLSLLREEITFGLNRIYLLFEKLRFNTSFLVVVNRLVIEQCADEIAALSIPKFVDVDTNHILPFTRDMIFLRCSGQPKSAPWFSPDPCTDLCVGGTVTYVAMQLAYFMGFEQVILIGVDHSFATKGDPHQVVVTQSKDLNHFDSNYFGKGFRWQLPDLERSELSYRLAKFHYERNNRKIFDATLQGNLDVFTKVEFKDLFR